MQIISFLKDFQSSPGSSQSRQGRICHDLPRHDMAGSPEPRTSTCFPSLKRKNLSRLPCQHESQYNLGTALSAMEARVKMNDFFPFFPVATGKNPRRHKPLHVLPRRDREGSLSFFPVLTGKASLGPRQGRSMDKHRFHFLPRRAWEDVCLQVNCHPENLLQHSSHLHRFNIKHTNRQVLSHRHSFISSCGIHESLMNVLECPCTSLFVHSCHVRSHSADIHLQSLFFTT